MGEAALALAEESVSWEPQPGPQTDFARCEADIAFFGGAAGGGKSFALLYEAAKWTRVRGVRAYRAILFRRTSPELQGGGGLWDESQAMYRDAGGRPRGAPALDWTFDAPSGRISDRHRIEFRHLVHESTVHEHQGRQYAFIGFDEVTHFTARQFWYMVSRLRSVSGVRPYVRATCNPDPDSFVAALIAWWIGEDGYPIAERSGVIRWFVRVDDSLHWFDSDEEARAAHPDSEPLSFTFVASRLADNRILLEKDPSYRGKLKALPRVERARLLGDEVKGGNWKIRSSAGMVFKRDDFELASSPPSRVIATVRFWDKAASEPTPKHPNPDWTRGVRVSLCEGAKLWIDDVVSMQARGVDVLARMREVAEKDTVAVTVGVWQDTGGAGATDADVSLVALAGFVVETIASFAADTTGLSETHRSSKPKRAFANAWAPWVENGSVYVKRDEEWTDELLTECDSFPDARHDDLVDAISGAFQVLVGSGFDWWQTVARAGEPRSDR